MQKGEAVLEKLDEADLQPSKIDIKIVAKSKDPSVNNSMETLQLTKKKKKASP